MPKTSAASPTTLKSFKDLPSQLSAKDWYESRGWHATKCVKHRKNYAFNCEDCYAIAVGKMFQQRKAEAKLIHREVCAAGKDRLSVMNSKELTETPKERWERKQAEREAIAKQKQIRRHRR